MATDPKVLITDTRDNATPLHKPLNQGGSILQGAVNVTVASNGTVTVNPPMDNAENVAAAQLQGINPNGTASAPGVAENPYQMVNTFLGEVCRVYGLSPAAANSTVTTILQNMREQFFN